MSDTPRTDREVYTVQKADVGFEVVNPALCRLLERELTTAREEIQRLMEYIHAD